MTDLAESLVESGVGVTALAGRGSYNGGGKLSAKEEHNGVVIERTWTSGLGKRFLIARLADYFSFYLGASWKLLILQRHDLVMVLTTPPLISLPALLICRLRGMKLISLVQDIYPDVAVALGALCRDSLFTNTLDRVNTAVLKRSDRIVVLGECMRERIAAKIGSDRANCIDVIHNWADGNRIAPLNPGERNPFAEEQGTAGRFVVLFSGNLGRVNDFATILQAALLLRSRPVLFLFIGDGAKRGEISTFVNRHNLSNVRVMPYQPRESLSFSLAAGNAHLVTLSDGLAGLSVPSKSYGILAAGRPIIFVGDLHSDIVRLISENGCGAVVPEGDVTGLTSIIAEWAADKELVTQMGLRARELFEQRFDRSHAVAAYMTTFKRTLGKTARADNSAPITPQPPQP